MTRQPEEILQTLPEERMAPYLDKCMGDAEKALSLYVWNTAASGAVYECLSYFEIALRNALDTALSDRHAFMERKGDWLDNKHNEFAPTATDVLVNAHISATRPGGKKPRRGSVIAELSFGFWRRLLDERYERHWGAAVMRNFPSLKRNRVNDMKNLRDLVDPIYSLRNRVAHHEPVWQINLSNREADMQRIVQLINEPTSKWVAEQSRLPSVLSHRPIP